MNKEQKAEELAKYQHLKDFMKKDLKFDVAPATMGDGTLADCLVHLRDIKSMVEAREKLLNKVLQSRHQEDLAKLQQAYDEDGSKEYFRVPGEITGGVTYEYVVQQRVDMEAITSEMGADWVEEHKKSTDFFQAKANKG